MAEGRVDVMDERLEMGAIGCVQVWDPTVDGLSQGKMTLRPPDGKCRAFCWTEWTVQRLIRQLSLSFSRTDSIVMLLVIISVAFKISSAVFCIRCANISLIICFLFYFSGKFFIRSDYIQLDWDPSSWTHEQNTIVFDPRYLVCCAITLLFLRRISTGWVGEEENGYCWLHCRKIATATMGELDS